LRFSGSIEDLRTGGKGPDERVFDVEVKRDLEAYAGRLRDAGCDVETEPPLKLVARVPEADGSTVLLREARALGTQVRRLEVRRESLEEAFLRVVGQEL